MSELVVEIERQRDAFKSLDRINTVERDVAVLRTRFEAAFETFLKELERSVSAEDIKELKREWETALREALNSVRDHFTSANEQQSNAILAQVELMLARDREAAATEAKKTRQQFQYLLLGAVLSIAGSLFVFWETIARG
jgi:Zn-dependent M32 family carboxypeptidase